jgi:hypothetical protein
MNGSTGSSYSFWRSPRGMRTHSDGEVANSGMLSPSYSIPMMTDMALDSFSCIHTGDTGEVDATGGFVCVTRGAEALSSEC